MTKNNIIILLLILCTFTNARKLNYQSDDSCMFPDWHSRRPYFKQSYLKGFQAGILTAMLTNRSLNNTDLLLKYSYPDSIIPSIIKYLDQYYSIEYNRKFPIWVPLQHVNHN